VIRAYCDESYKGTQVYAIGGVVARDRRFRIASIRWKNRRLRDGIKCFHAADCEDGREEFANLSKEQRIELKADLTGILLEAQITGVGAAIITEDFNSLRAASEQAKSVLGPSPYFLCLQMLITSVCVGLGEHNPNVRVAYIFEEQEQFSSRAKQLYNKFKIVNPQYAKQLGSLTYAQKGEFVPLEMADNIAYETMKEILNHFYDSARPRRKSMERMIPSIGSLTLLTKREMLRLVERGIPAQPEL
jgi:hypothetical protein